jgi:beta-galactosidase
MNRTSLDRGWNFTPGGFSFYSSMMPQSGQTVDLPHDFTIGSEVTKDAPNGSAGGYYQGGIGYYTQFLDIPAEWEGRRILVEIDGAYMNTEVRLNGNFVTSHPYGYTPFHADLTPYINYGKKNRLVITINNSAPKNARWYSGSGLYRHVDILTAPKIHLAPWSIFAHTDRIENGTAYITVEVSAENHTDTPVTRQIKVSLAQDENAGKPAASGDLYIHIPAMGIQTGMIHLAVENAVLWDIDNPRLYIVKAELGETDSDTAIFGIRTITVDPKNGLKVNGKPIKIKGGCVHHDNGILGSASFYDSEYRRMKLHKDNGFNGIRSAHNPPSRDMLEACDRLGLLVIDEAFDMWQMSDNQNDYHIFFDAWWKKDMELFMRRDRNHPCIIMWSIGNEIQERNGLSNGYQLVAQLAAFARTLDPTRLITSSIPVTFNGLDDDDMAQMMLSWQEMIKKEDAKLANIQNLGNPFSDKIWGPRTAPFASPLDVVGYNYLDGRYEEDGKTYPHRVICGEESYPRNIDIIWEKVKKFPYVIGDFTWTSFDYIGEAGLGQAAYLDDEGLKKCNPLQGAPVNFPWRLAYCGDFDLCGFDRPQLHLRKIVWGSDETYLTVSNPANNGKNEVLGRWGWTEAYPAWQYTGYEGQPVKAIVFSAADEVELILNGKSIGKKSAGKTNRFRAEFDLVYEPGTLIAVSLKAGVEVSRMELITPGAAAGLRLLPEKHTIKADGQSLCYVLVEIVDAQEHRIFFSDRKAHATVNGAGRLAAFGTGRPVTAENYTLGEFTSFQGRWLTIIRSAYEPGNIKLVIEADGLKKSEITIQTK